MKKLLLLIPFFTFSCADTWSEKATSTADKKTSGANVLQALPVGEETSELPNSANDDNALTFVTPDTTTNLVGEAEKRSVNPELSVPERPPLDSNTVNTSPPAPVESPPKD